jgi:cytochrome b subunit of formate dehydrogenase
MSNTATFLGGSLIGGIPNWVLLLLLAIGLLGGVFERWGVWLTEHGRIARSRCDEKIASHRADELQERLMNLEARMGKRAEELPKELHPIVARLDKSTDQINKAATYLADINIEEAAERSFRAAMPSMESTRGLSKLEKNIAQTTGRTIREKLSEVRPALSILKQEAPRLKADATKLHDMDQKFNKNVKQINDAFAEFETIMRSEDRAKIASRASIVVPWVIALLIMTIALSGVFLNFFLIERPMAEIVGEGARIGGVGLPTFAALIVIFLEFVTGVILMDSLGFTRLIPAFESMSDKGKKILAFIAFAFLAAFSVLEMTLSIVREQIIEQQQETRDLANAALIAPNLAPAPAAASPDATAPAEDGAAAQPATRKDGLQMSTIAQLILAAIIPWLLAAAALPLETIIRSSVFMVSIVSSYLLLTLGFICRSIGAPSQTIGRLFSGAGDGGRAKADKAEERAARKQMKKNKKDDDEGQGRNREDDLMVVEPEIFEGEAPQQNGRRDKRQRELQRA